jgi:FAD/FMN-containing dehydrogenase
VGARRRGRAQAGIRLSDLEKATRPLGWELRCMPSTWRSATLGGLYGGGFGGIGSINYGPLGSRGNVLGIKAITFEEEPKLVELRGAEALLLHHMWGTNGWCWRSNWRWRRRMTGSNNWWCSTASTPR